MPQIYEYILKINDLASGKMKSFSSASTVAMGKVMNSVDRAKKSIGSTVTPLDTLRKRLDAVSRRRDLSVNTSEIRRANREIRSIEKEMMRLEKLSSKKLFAGQFGSLAKMAAASFGTMAAFNFGKSIVQLGSNLEQANVSFTVLTGSASKATQLIADARAMSIKTPFESSDLLDAAKMMLNFGIAQEEVMGHMKRLGDVSGGNKEKFKGLTLAFSQMHSTGRLMGQDLLQMINAGFNPLQEISSKTGKSLATLKDEMSAGLISTDMVIQAFKDATGEGGRFNGMLDKQSQTLAGKWSTLIGGIKERLADSGLAINVWLKKVVQFGIDAMNNLSPISDAFGKIWQAAKTVFAAVWNSVSPILSLFTQASEKGNGVASTMQAIGGVLEYLSYPLQVLGSMVAWVIDKFGWLVIGYGLVTAAQWAWNVAMTANPIGLIIGGIAVLVGSVMYAWDKFEGFRKVVLGVWEVMKSLATIAFQVAKALVQIYTGNFSGAVKSIKKAFETGKDIGEAYKRGEQKGIRNVATKNKVVGSPLARAIQTSGGPGMSAQNGDFLSPDNAPVNSTGSNSPQVGGTKSITIEIGKVGADTITLHTQTLQEGVSEVKEQFLDMFLSVLNGSQKLATQ